MNCKYSVNKKKINGKRAWLFQPSDQVTPYHWSRLKSFMEAAGGVYKKYLYSFVFEEDPRKKIQAYVDRYCEGNAVEEPFRYSVKTKTSHVGPTQYQDMIATRVRNSQKPNHKKKKKGQKKSRKAWEPTEKFLLQKESIENAAEILRLKAEGEKLSNEVGEIHLADQEKRKIDQENQETERQNNLAKKESKRKEEIINVAREILSAETEDELDQIGKTWKENKAIGMFIAGRRGEIKEDNKSSQAVTRKKAVVDALIAVNGKVVNYHWIRTYLNIEPKKDQYIIHGIYLDRIYMFLGFIVTIPRDLKIPDFNLKLK